jgi:hypothetical protein
MGSRVCELDWRETSSMDFSLATYSYTCFTFVFNKLHRTTPSLAFYIRKQLLAPTSPSVKFGS